MKISEHGGDTSNLKIEYDFSINVNPLGMPEEAKIAARRSIEIADRYPAVDTEELRQKLVDFHRDISGAKLDKDDITLGNGAAELIYAICFGLRVKKALVFSPCFSEYEKAVKAAGGEVYKCEITGKINELQVDIIFITNPNNPDGSLIDRDGIVKLLALINQCKARKIHVVVDECFLTFVERNSELTMLKSIKDYPNLIVLRSFTKSFALAGLRIGYMACSDKAVNQQIRKCLQPWNISAPAQAAATACLDRSVYDSYLANTVQIIKEEREYLVNELNKLESIEVFPGAANFIMFKIKGVKACLYQYLIGEGILIRSCANYDGLDESYFRIAVRTHDENKILIDKITKYYKRLS